MKNKELQNSLKMGMNLQFFAGGDDTGADDGNGSGTDTISRKGVEKNTDTTEDIKNLKMKQKLVMSN